MQSSAEALQRGGANHARRMAKIMSTRSRVVPGWPTDATIPNAVDISSTSGSIPLRSCAVSTSRTGAGSIQHVFAGSHRLVGDIAPDPMFDRIGALA